MRTQNAQSTKSLKKELARLENAELDCRLDFSGARALDMDESEKRRARIEQIKKELNIEQE